MLQVAPDTSTGYPSYFPSRPTKGMQLRLLFRINAAPGNRRNWRPAMRGALMTRGEPGAAFERVFFDEAVD